MDAKIYHLTQVQEFTEVLPSGRWSRTYMLPGTTLMSVPGFEGAGDVAPWKSVMRFRVWAAPLFFDGERVEGAGYQPTTSQDYVHWTGWVYLPVEAVREGAWVAR